jgi:hypothetical protein
VAGNTFTYNNVTTGLSPSGGGTAALPLHWNATGQMLLTNAPNSRGSFTLSSPSSITDLLNNGPRVAMFPTAAGTPAPFVVTWASFVSSNNNYSILAATFNPNGSARTAAFQVNEPPAQLQPTISPPTIGWQLMPDVSVDSQGHFTIVWSSFGQDNAEVGKPSVLDYGIYARMFNANGTNYFDPALGIYPLEFRVNATTQGNQVAPAVASDDPSDNSVVVWVGPDTLANGTTAIYDRVLDPPVAGPAKALPPAAGTPLVKTNPASQTVAAGATVVFTAAATGTPNPTVQWQVSTNNGASFFNLAGATGTSYGLVGAAGSQSGYEYRAVFTNSLGSATSAAATLTVNTPVAMPAVTTNPVSQAVSPLTTVTFTAAALGTPTPTVQWQVSTNNGATYSSISGATSTSYKVTASSGNSGSMYRAVFTNSAGTATTSSALLTVYLAPSVTTNPVSQAVALNTQVVFTAAAAGAPAPTVQWQSSTNGTTWVNIAGATSTSLPIVASSANSGTQYRAVFTNSQGSATTTAAKLTVGAAPVVLTGPYAMSVATGATVTYTASASGSPAPTVQWQFSSNHGLTFTNIAGATALTYKFTAAAVQNGYWYRAVFTNTGGTAATPAAVLTVTSTTVTPPATSPPVVLTGPYAMSVAPGASVTYSASASGTPTPTVQWQMSANHGLTFTNIAGATALTYKFTATAAQNGYWIRAVFTNSAGTAATPAAVLTVTAAKSAAKMATPSAVAAASAAAVAAPVSNLDNGNNSPIQNGLSAAAIDAVMAERL